MNTYQNDEAEQFISELKNDLKPSVEFKDSLYKRLESHYNCSSICMKIRSFFRNDFFVTGAGSVAILLIVFSFLCWQKTQPIFTPGRTQQITPPKINTLTFGAKRDDWNFKYTREVAQMKGTAGGGGSFVGSILNSAPGMNMAPQSMRAEADLGFSVGGAKDIANFRENIKNRYLPLPTDITYEGIFYDYFFDTGKQKECTELFCPSYSYAVSKDPFSQESEYYMTVGLNSGIKESQFHRKNLNVMVVLDISGSMGSPFDQYYYDRTQSVTPKESAEERNKTKMKVANEAIVAMLEHLQPQDRFGMALFDDSAYEAKPLSYVGEADMNAIKNHILEIKEQGSTNHEAGYTKGMDLIKIANLPTDPDYETRIIFLTDAMPNTGNTDKNSLLGMVSDAAQKNIYTTFIGVGIDFNSELIEAITKVRGANYYSVHSSEEFKKRMDTEFEYMVTPLVFDLSLDFQSEGWDIEKVYGSPDTDPNSGKLMYVRTLFPSATAGGETKGGVVLLKLKSRQNKNPSIKLTATYTDREGKMYQKAEPVAIPFITSDYYQTSGIHKAILLTRYVNLMKNFILSKRASVVYHPVYITIPERGILPPDEKQFSEWERTSIPLELSEEDKAIFKRFTLYFEQDSRTINDSTLNQEVEILNKLNQ